ncbi:D-aminoacyl-tRNA deacylase [Trujillonella humicola]|uniref:D-aminoacyl-tRNA deacylase n=1 Tax=Trujillonella humicola TaxID=3383699 RepID=UPI003906647C
MRAVVSRVVAAAVTVEDVVVGEIGRGLLALVGVARDDDPAGARRLAGRIHELRIFPSGTGEVSAADLGLPVLVVSQFTLYGDTRKGRRPSGTGEVSAADLGLPVLVVSQFTLYGDTRKGRRPSWTDAAPGEVAEPLVAEVVEELRRRGATVATGVFGARMLVSSVNEGPMTLLLEI